VAHDVPRAPVVAADIREDRAELRLAEAVSIEEELAASTLLRMAPIGWLISCAIDAASSPRAVSFEAWASRCVSSSLSRRSLMSTSRAMTSTGRKLLSRTTKPSSTTCA
jgi:hypothetical protein